LRTSLALLLSILTSACTVPLVTNGPIGLTVVGPPRSQTTQVAGFVRELRELAVTLPNGGMLNLEAFITRPAGKSRLPLILLSHGSPHGGEDARSAMAPTVYAAQSMAFARRGYAAVVVMRRGYGRSQGTNAENAGPCTDRDYFHAAHVSGDDLVATLAVLAREDWVDPTRVVLLGQSAGGFASLAAAAERPDGVLGVISFAGGRGSDVSGHVCQPLRLVEAFEDLGKRVRIPSLWVYADNDQSFDPPLAHDFASGYAAGGAPLQFIAAPAFGDDGHFLFSQGAFEEWWQWVAPFLATLGLPTELALPAPPAPVLKPGPQLAPSIQPKFAEYLASEGFEKAFAVGPKGWGRSTGKRTEGDAIEGALKACREHSEGCAVYAIGNAYAPGVE
jgi:dienelactone hydrolase